MLWILSQMAESIAEMKAKLDSVLSCIEDIKEPKQKQRSLEEKNKQLEASLEFAHTSTKELREKVAVQDEAIDELKKGVKSLTKQVAYEKERAIKLESNNRRNNLNFFRRRRWYFFWTRRPHWKVQLYWIQTETAHREIHV